MTTIPKKIHFIWIGGPVKEKYIPTLMKMSELAKRSGFEINLWVDDENNLEKSKYFHNSDLDHRRIPHLRIRTLNDLKSKFQNHSFYTEEIIRQFEYTLNREMLGLKNLGAAADLLRYAILLEEGGYYCDIDTKFTFNDKDVMDPDDAQKGILLTVSISQDNTITLTNDLIAAIPDHEIMQNAVLNILGNYKKLDAVNTLGEFQKFDEKNFFKIDEKKSKEEKYQLNLMDKKRGGIAKNPDIMSRLQENRENLTLIATGPSLLQALTYDYFKKNGDGEASAMSSIAFDRLEGESFSYKMANIMATSRSDQNWLDKYDLALMKDEQKATIKFKCRPEGLEYCVTELNHQLKTGIIQWKQLPDEFPRQDENVIKERNGLLPEILKVTSEVGHTKLEKYNLVLMLDPRKGIIEFKCRDDGLEYRVMGPDDKLKRGKIQWKSLPAKFPKTDKEIIKEKKRLLPEILKITSKVGHTKCIEKSFDDFKISQLFRKSSTKLDVKKEKTEAPSPPLKKSPS